MRVLVLPDVILTAPVGGWRSVVALAVAFASFTGLSAIKFQAKRHHAGGVPCGRAANRATNQRTKCQAGDHATAQPESDTSDQFLRSRSF